MSVGKGLHSIDDFECVMGTSLCQDTSLAKFPVRYDQQLSFGQVRHHWYLAEVCTLRMISKMQWALLWI